MRNCTAMLGEFGVAYEAKVLSAHRTPKEAADWAAGALDRGIKVIIAAAGGAAHLAGAMAAQTVLPVLGVPMTGWALDGLDSLLATVHRDEAVPESAARQMSVAEHAESSRAARDMGMLCRRSLALLLNRAETSHQSSLWGPLTKS